ncbi:hypothetical protein [Sulfurimonas sp.]|uniref:hypothetical protein n=1 Tax=Sulfurimonas sp. TaxID=2022749 RepID=UPI003D0A643A
MARAKFDKLITDETPAPTKTHLDLQKKQGRPTGSKVKAEQSTASITIALTASQKQELEVYAKSEFRSVGSVIKMLLIQKGIIKMNE